MQSDAQARGSAAGANVPGSHLLRLHASCYTCVQHLLDGLQRNVWQGRVQLVQVYEQLAFSKASSDHYVRRGRGEIRIREL